MFLSPAPRWIDRYGFASLLQLEWLIPYVNHPGDTHWRGVKLAETIVFVMKYPKCVYICIYDFCHHFVNQNKFHIFIDTIDKAMYTHIEITR